MPKAGLPQARGHADQREQHADHVQDGVGLRVTGWGFFRHERSLPERPSPKPFTPANAEKLCHTALLDHVKNVRDVRHNQGVIETVRVTDAAFDEALTRFALIDDQLVSVAALGRTLERDEELSRYAFTGLCEALRSEEFEEDPFETVQDLELEQTFTDEDDAWEAIKDFYAERACVLLHVGDAEEFIVGREIVMRLGLL